MTSARIFLSPPNIGDFEIDHVVRALRSGWVAPVGPELEGFEADVASFVGVEAAVALSSGTAALHLGLLALGVRPGNEVICPTLTFAATAFAIRNANATPIFLDSEPMSWNLDPQVLNEVLRAKASSNVLPSAIVAVDVFGRTCDYGNVLAVANRYEVPVLVDAAEALGANWQGRAAGSLGRAAVFSFNGNKIITTSGGGMLVGNNVELVERARFWSTQSREDLPWYEHREIGFNYRMSNILAALGRAQLERLPSIVAKRRLINDWYREALDSANGVDVIADPPWGRSNAWITTIRIDASSHTDGPTRVREALESHNIEARPVWKPMHQQPVFLEYEAHLTGSADLIFSEGLCLPSGVALEQGDVERISELILATLGA